MRINTISQNTLNNFFSVNTPYEKILELTNPFKEAQESDEDSELPAEESEETKVEEDSLSEILYGNKTK